MSYRLLAVRCQDGRAVQGAAFRSQSGSPGVGSNPTSDNVFRFCVQTIDLFLILRVRLRQMIGSHELADKVWCFTFLVNIFLTIFFGRTFC